MSEASAEDIAKLLLRDVDGFERELALFPDEESVWKTVSGVPNSAGNLTLHIAGNLQHFIGGVLGKSGYVRDRDREFGAKSGSRQWLVSELHAAAQGVRTVLPSMKDGWYDVPFPEPVVAGRQIPTGRFLLHLCVHAGFHLGQVGYLRRALTGDARSSHPVSLNAVCD